MDRRGFITGLFAMAAVPFIPKQKPDYGKIQQRVINAHIDLLNLRLHRPYVRIRNKEIGNMRVYPGKIVNVSEYALIEVERVDKIVREVTGKCESL